MDWFSTANLYDFPRVTVSSFSSEIDSQETKVRLIATNFKTLQSDAQRESYEDFPTITSLR